MGWTWDEIRERFDNKFQNMIVDEDNALIEELVEKIADSNIGSSIYRMYHKDGGYRWVQDSTILVETEDEKFYQGAISDVTDFIEDLRKLTMSADEKRAIASKDEILSKITQMLYSYNLTLNVRTGEYSLITGTGLEEFVEFYKNTSDYETAYNYKLNYVSPVFREAYIDLVSIENLRKIKGKDGHIGTLQYSVELDSETQWHEINVFMSVDGYGERIVNLLCRDITEAHDHQEKRENELRAMASKDQILSEITQTLYSYNLTLNLTTGKYSLITGTGLEEYIQYFQTSEEYEKAFYFNLANVETDYRHAFMELTGIESLRRKSGEKGFVGSLQYPATLGVKTSWQEMNVFIGTNENGEDVANLLCRDITESHNSQEMKENEFRASVSKDQILSGITKMLYSYNLTLNLKSGKYGLIVGTGMENFVSIFQATDDYKEAFEKKLSYVEPRFVKEFRELAALANLRKMSEKKGFVKSLEYSCMVNGKQEWHEINVFMGNNAQGEDIANLLGRDITETYAKKDTENKLEIAQASNEAKTRFLSNMSHDIRTPINGIMGMLHIAKTHRDDEQKVDDCLNKIETSTNYLLTLLNDILDLNKLESGKTVKAEDPFNVVELLDDICSIIQPTAHVSGIVLEKKIESIEHPYVIGSTLHLRQILMNLTSNAIKYSNDNGMVQICVEELETEGDMVRYCFRIKDNGIGMTKEFQQKMFEMFEQEHSGARSKHMGSGLGLAIVKMLVDLLGGELSVESKKGKGSTFTVVLPFKINYNPIEKKTETIIDTTDCLKNVHVLVVEDNEFNMEIAQVILQEAGAIVTAAVNGKMAVELFESSPEKTFDIILMDVMMPEMDGLEATRTIRSIKRPEAKEIPIIAMTANAFEEDVKKSLDAGMDAHIAKPLDMATLAVAVAKLLK